MEPFFLIKFTFRFIYADVCFTHFDIMFLIIVGYDAPHHENTYVIPFAFEKKLALVRRENMRTSKMNIPTQLRREKMPLYEQCPKYELHFKHINQDMRF